MSICHKPYPSDVSDEEWSLVAPYLLLQREDVGQREHDLREVVRDYAIKHLGADDAVLIVAETGFVEQGKASWGVGRQYTRSAGKVTNCQIGVFAAYVSGKGHAFVGRALYLPKSWA